MGIATTIGLDIAKSVFQVHGVDAAGEVVIRRKLTRGRVLGFFENLPRCLVGIEACSSSHYWARELIARGHDVRLLPAQYVKPYLKRQKNDAADAEAICEAVTRPTMRFVPVKTPEQQSVMMLLRVRLMLNRQRTQLSNALRAHITKMGDRYLRKLLVIGATSLIQRARHKPKAADPRLLALLARKPARVASVAMTNKMARVV